MPRGQRDELFAPPVEVWVGGDHQRTGPLLGERGEGWLQVTVDAGVLNYNLQPKRLPRDCRGRQLRLGVHTCRVHQQTHYCHPGSISRSSSNCFPTNSPARLATPVALPPGRLKLATSPSLTGSTATLKTIGILFVAAIAACAAEPLKATITATGRPTSSAAISGNRSYRPSAQRNAMCTFWPST